MPRAGTISIRIDPKMLRVTAQWLEMRAPREPSWLVSREQIDASEALLAALTNRIGKASVRKGGARVIAIERQQAQAFVSRFPRAYPHFGAAWPRDVRRFQAVLEKGLRVKRGPSRRSEPRGKNWHADPLNPAGMEKVYRRRLRQRQEIEAILSSGQSVLGHAIASLDEQNRQSQKSSF